MEIKDEILNLDLGKLNLESIDNNVYKEALSEISNISDFKIYLKETMALDIKRYFFTSKESQDLVKGAYNRTKYLYDLLCKISENNLTKQ